MRWTNRLFHKSPGKPSGPKRSPHSVHTAAVEQVMHVGGVCRLLRQPALGKLGCPNETPHLLQGLVSSVPGTMGKHSSQHSQGPASSRRTRAAAVQGGFAESNGIVVAHLQHAALSGHLPGTRSESLDASGLLSAAVRAAASACSAVTCPRSSANKASLCLGHCVLNKAGENGRSTATWLRARTLDKHIRPEVWSTSPTADVTSSKSAATASSVAPWMKWHVPLLLGTTQTCSAHP